MSLPVAAFRAGNALAALKQHTAKPALVIPCGDEHSSSLAAKQGSKCFLSDFGLYLVGEHGKVSLTVRWE